MNHITAEAIAAVDDTAAFAFDNVVHIKHTQPIQSAEATVDQCHTALQQSLAHYRAAGKMSRNQAVKQTLLTRAAFLKAEAGLMFDEQWEAFGTEIWLNESQRINARDAFDVIACMAAWQVWDADGHTLYQALLHRAATVEAEATAVQL